MLQRHDQVPATASVESGRFDSESVRRILQRAAEVQHRLDIELADSYSLEELEEMAAEARISPEALQVAISAHHHEADAPGASAGPRTVAGRHPGDSLSRLERWMPGSWSPALKGLVLASGGVLALAGVLLTLALLAPTAFWVTSATLLGLSLLALIGASPI